MPDMERYLPGSLWSHLSGRAAGEHPDHSATSTTSSHCNNADRARLLNWIINNKNTCLLDWNARLDCTGCFQGVVTWQYLPALYKNAPHQSDREGRALFRSGLSSGQAVATWMYALGHAESWTSSSPFWLKPEGFVLKLMFEVVNPST